MRRVLPFLVLMLVCSSLGFAFASKNPLPLVYQSLSPVSTAPGGAAFTLTVRGTGFVAGAVVKWNGGPRSTKFVSSSELTASIAAADIATASTAWVTVANPGPGGGSSNVVYFPIAAPTPVVALTSKNYPITQFGDYGNGIVVTGDINGDGKLDVVSNAYSPDGVFVYLGNGDGTLQPEVFNSSPCGYGPIILADFNNDGKPDIFSLSVGGEYYCVMLGNGDGTFQPGTIVYLPGEGVGELVPVLGDFNGDGNLDLAVAEPYSETGQYIILLGNGDGTFQTQVETDSTSNVGAMAVGDFNGDGKLDLIAGANFGGLQLLLGNGDGTFQSGIQIPVTQPLTPLMVADFDGDGKLDIAGSSGETMSVLLGNGDGTFKSEVNYPAAYGTNCTNAGDFNNDGKLDLGCSPNFAGGSVSIFFGNGDGSFQPQSSYPGETGLTFSVALGDFNNDGQLDLAAGEYSSGTTVLLQTTVQALPDALSFPTQPVGTKSANQSTIITNLGNSMLDISNITITGTNASDFTQTNTCGTSLNAGASCAITVQFDPSIDSVEDASVAITDNAKGTPQLISLAGSGTSELMTPHVVKFGAVTVGQSSKPVVVTLKNENTTGYLLVGQIALWGTDHGDFSQNNNCPSSLLAGASCQINVTFTPTAKGNRTGSIRGYLLPIPTFLQGTGK